MSDPAQNSDAHFDSLFALARKRRADTSKAEFAFETRLLARLHSQKDSHSVFAMVSWRLMPFFGACAVALFLWEGEITMEANDAVGVAGMQNPEAVDLWNGLN